MLVLCEYGVKNHVLLPAVGQQNTKFPFNLTQPGNRSLEVPCRNFPPPCRDHFRCYSLTMKIEFPSLLSFHPSFFIHKHPLTRSNHLEARMGG